MPDQVDLDSVFNRVASLAESRDLPESRRDDTPSLLVGDSCFARLLDGATLMLDCPQEQKILLMDISPDIYFETDQYIGQDVVLIRLAAIGDEELALRLEDAWRFRAPSRVSKQRS